MKTIKRVNKAVVNVTLRIVVQGNFSDKTTDNAVDNFLNRALQSDIPSGLYTEGLIATKLVDQHIIHQWEEIEEHEIL